MCVNLNFSDTVCVCVCVCVYVCMCVCVYILVFILERSKWISTILRTPTSTYMEDMTKTEGHDKRDMTKGIKQLWLE